MPGANRDVTRFTNMNLFNMSDVYWRLFQVAMSNQEGGSTYTIEEYLNDVEKLVFKDLLKGKLVAGGETIITSYIAMYMQLAPVMMQNYKDRITGYDSFACQEMAESFRVAVSGVPVDCVEDLQNYAWIYMQRAQQLLKKSKAACKNDVDRRKIDYIITVAEKAMGK